MRWQFIVQGDQLDMQIDNNGCNARVGNLTKTTLESAIHGSLARADPAKETMDLHKVRFVSEATTTTTNPSCFVRVRDCPANRIWHQCIVMSLAARVSS